MGDGDLVWKLSPIDGQAVSRPSEIAKAQEPSRHVACLHIGHGQKLHQTSQRLKN